MTSSDHTLSLLRAGKLAGAPRLDLACGLTEFPREIFDLADTLEVLNLSQNQLDSLPDDLPRLRKLRILFASENRFQHLPGVLGACSNLSMVGFKSNQIETVDAGAFPESLRWLILTDNRIRQLPGTLGRCVSLQKLMLAGNQLSHLPDEMAACVNLELLRLAANRFESLPDWLLELPRLSWLALGGNPFCGEVTPAAASVAEIDFADLELQDKLGEGASGVISKAHWKTRSQPVAVKLFKGAVTSDGLPSSEMAASLAAGSHGNLVPLLGKISQHPTGANGLVMALIPPEFRTLAGPPSLDSCTRDIYAEETKFSLPVILQMALGIASAAEHLHARGVIHGDLYAHNILWNAAGTALLGDFGAASFGHLETLFPRLQRLEVRAFGCLLEELLARCESEIPAQIRSLRDRYLSGYPRQRPLFEEVRKELEELVARFTSV